MKKLFKYTLGLLLLAWTVLPASAAFSSLYVFGDALSTTTGNPNVGPSYYGNRFSNGRVWVEVLAQRQSLVYDFTKNNSYFDHNSSNLVTDIKNFIPPADVTNDLFIVWVCNADIYDSAASPSPLNSAQWQAANNVSQTNHLQIITNLYAKGVRTLILPNAVDISTIPAFNQSAGASLSLMHNGCVDFNTKFSNTLNQAKALCPNLKIYAPDYYTLLNNALANAAYYGLTNVLYLGKPIDAIDYLGANCNTNGLGSNFVFWDYADPTARFHAVMADTAQQLIAPGLIGKIIPLVGSNRLDVVNLPVGLNGFVDSLTNLTLTNWTSLQSFNSTNAAQSVFVPATGLQSFYRLRYPFAWNWP